MRTWVRDVAGPAYGRFHRALSTGNLQVVEATAAELPKVALKMRLRS